MAQETNNPIKVLFIGFVGRSYSRSSTILNYETSHLEKKYFETPANLRKAFIALLKNKSILRECSVIIVMSPCHMLTPLIKFIIRKPVILDAGWALTDGELSRGIKGKRVFNLPLIYVTDLIAFICSNLILVETNLQVERLHKLFHIKKNKLRVSLTGINERDFNNNLKDKAKIEDITQRTSFKNAKLKILFRGKMNRESGIDVIINAARENNPEKFYIFVIGAQDQLKNMPANVAVLKNLSSAELKEVYAISDMCIGQFSTHPRLRYTIPHKAFEAAFFGKPYITALSPGIRDFLSTKDAMFVEHPTSENLIRYIEKLSEFNKRDMLGTNIRNVYNLKASQKIINLNFEKIVTEITTDLSDREK